MLLTEKDAGVMKNPQDLRYICEDTVRKLIAENDWRLLDEQTFVSRLLDKAQNLTNLTSPKLRKHATNIYCSVLYRACLGDEGRGRQNRGYTELHRYLYRSAFHKRPDLAEDAAQEAIQITYEKIDQCREPGAFLAFANYKLMHALGRVQRASADVPITMPLEEFVEVIAVHNPTELPEDEAARRELCAQLLEAISQLPDQQKRMVVTLRYFGDYSDKEIAARLGISDNNVRVLRNRAMKHLSQILAKRLGNTRHE